MENVVLFTNSFLEYLIVFGISVAVVIAACLLGVTMKKHKDARMELEAAGADQTQEAKQEKAE